MEDIYRQPVVDHLTQRELEILRLIAEGLTNQDIAKRLFITYGTVKWYVKQIYGKLRAGAGTQHGTRAGAHQALCGHVHRCTRPGAVLYTDGSDLCASV